MGKKPRTAITPTREEDYPEWFQSVVREADLAENSPVRGCMVIKPRGYGIWENIQRDLNKMFKETGHKNAYFPLLIPLEFLEREAEHVKGFAKECAVVTHHRLEESPDGGLVPAGKLDEPLVIRPTSETIIGAMFSKWVQSYRDLPLLINQWANIVRWEMRPRLFLRTTEFLWQEGHTVHATEEEALEETMKMLDIYETFAQDHLAIPVIKGEKSKAERFPGAVSTFSIEAMMQDRKALQSGTSHFLGQNFSKTFDISFQNDAGADVFGWTTSWGVSTRLIGAVIMTHSDDDGLILPPRVAPSQIVILPVIHNDDVRSSVMEYCDKLKSGLSNVMYHGNPLSVEIDTSQRRGGDRLWGWIKKGVPIRLEIGPRDIENESVFVAHRNKSGKERFSQTCSEFVGSVTEQLDSIQNDLFEKAVAYRKEHTRTIDSKDDLYAFFTPENSDKPEIHGGFAMCHWDGSSEVEEKIKEDLNVTIRCIPLGDKEESGTCVISGNKSLQRVVLAKAY